MILKLRPLNCEDDKRYSYYIMAVGPDLQPYFVTVRGVDEFKAKYDKEFTSQRLHLDHPDGCVYEDENTIAII